MAYQKISTSTTTFLKDGAGYIRNFSVPNAGTGWTMTLNDIGPSGAVAQVTSFPISIGLALNAPMFFPHGIQIVTTGAAPGELDVDFF
jgi:hypothetical protein